MIVFFKNIPTGIKKFEFAKFIETSFNTGGIGRDSLYVPIGDIDIFEYQGADSHSMGQFGMVRIGQTTIANNVIKKLNGCTFRKSKITVRKFFNRETTNDPRLRNQDTPEVFKEQRLKDRRENTLTDSRHL